MTDQDVEKLIEQARVLERKERQKFLAALDPSTRGQVDRAMADHAQGDCTQQRRSINATEGESTLSEANVPEDSTSLGSTVSRAPTRDDELDQIGPFRILQPIGMGGMGQVFMAEQMQPVKRRVALKVIKTDTPTKEILARFEAERQALAMMDHQNIAKVLDAGVTTDGRPYFAMELVKGIPITDYCDKNKLAPEDRLELFTQTCRAIQHAHMKGIIHRDIKPSNVLVTLYDGKPAAKVIDFGLAKALQDQVQLTNRTLFTQYGQVIGTLAYMSPEQAEMNALDIDTRTDVYSLGVILYELLTGSTPITRDTIKGLAFDRILGLIREEEAMRPSQRLSESGEKISGISEQRKTEPNRLRQILRGDLDWIAIKALEKDRTRRYDTPAALAEDVQRFLSNEAIEARPPSFSYRFRKTLHKHFASFVTAGAAVVLLVVGLLIVASLWLEAREAKNELESALVDTDKHRRKALKEKNTAELALLDAEEQRRRALTQTNAAKLARQNTETALNRFKYLLSDSRWKEGRLNDAVRLLEEIPPDDRHLEWNLARNEYEGSGYALYGHTGDVFSVRFSPDGKQCASCGVDRTIRLWDSVTGEVIRTLEGHEDAVNSLCFSPDGTRLVTGSEDMTARIWDSSTGQLLQTLPHRGPVLGVQFSPDGNMIGTCGGKPLGLGGVKLWNADSGTLIRNFVGARLSWVRGLSFSPDGTKLASTSPTVGTQLWNVATGELMAECDTLSISVSFTPDGKFLVLGKGQIEFWDPTLREQIRTISPSKMDVFTFAISPDGTRIASCSMDGPTRTWALESGEELFSIKGHYARVVNLDFSPNSCRLASATLDGTVRLNDLSERTKISTSGHINCVRVSPEGSMIACGEGNPFLKEKDGAVVRIWDTRTFQPIHELFGHEGGVLDICFSADGSRLASASSDNTIRIWDCQSGSELTVLDGHGSHVRALSFLDDGTRIVSGSRDGTLKIWDLAKGSELLSLQGHQGSVYDIAVSPNERAFASAGEDGLVKLWDARDGKEIETLAGHASYVLSLAFSPSGLKIASTSGKNTVIIWDLKSASVVGELIGHKGPLKNVSFSPDGSRLVSSSMHGDMKIWDSDSYDELRTLPIRGATDMCFTPNGMQVLYSTGKAIEFWDGRNKLQESRRFYGQRRKIKSVGVNVTKGRIYTEDEVGQTIVWDMRTHEELELVLDSGELSEFHNVSQDGRWLVFATGSEAVLVDRQFKLAANERRRREYESLPNPEWHATMAENAEKRGGWFAATFHAAARVKLQPESEAAHNLLQTAWSRLHPDQKVLLPRQVHETIKLTRPTSPSNTPSRQ